MTGKRESVAEAPSVSKHAERVAANFPPDTLAHKVALYHDHIEDGLGPVPFEVYAHVLLLTREADETYADYIDRIRGSGSAVAIAVKLADLRDNLARCRGDFGGFIKPHLARRYTTAILALDPVPA
jgi:hypothetical protein